MQPFMSPAASRSFNRRLRRDVQSLNNRLTVIEEKLIGIPDPTANLLAKAQGRLTKHDGPSASTSSTPRAYLAVAPHGASVAVNLEGTTGIWLHHVGIGPPNSGAPSADDTKILNNVDIQPASGVREEGVIDFLVDFTKRFRVSGKPMEQSNDDEEDAQSFVGVTPRLVLSAIPPADVRARIYPFYEANHIRSPSMNFIVFKQRIEDMCKWAESKGADYDEPDPISPSVNFFAAAILAVAVGIECMFIESDSKPVPASAGASPTDQLHAGGPGSSPAALARSMGPPPVPQSPYPLDPSSLPQTDPSVLFRLSTLALALSEERTGYDAYDLDYLHAKTLQIRYLLLSQHGLENGSHLRLEMSIRERKYMPKRGKGKGKNSKQADTIMVDASTSAGKDIKTRSSPLALAPGIAKIIGELVAVAKSMGLDHDPDSPGGEKFSLYTKEMRRRLWWDIVGLDV